MGIALENISKWFGNFPAVDCVNLEIKPGSLVALLGPSGCGKSTLLRLISGLETPDGGRIWLKGVEATQQPVRERNIGYLFPDYALFGHLTVWQNIAFGLEIRANKQHPQWRSKIDNKVAELLELIQLSSLGTRYPHQLSGGQRQRVALARALASEPEVLLLDEPFGALDVRVRRDLRAWLRQLHDRTKVTTIFVTQDRTEAMEVADTIAIINKGRIEQVGTPTEIYEHPANSFVMSFLSPVNVLPSGLNLVRGRGIKPLAPQAFIHPQDLEIETTKERATLGAKVNRSIPLGADIQVELALEDGQIVTAQLTRERFNQLQLEPQQQVFIKPKAAQSLPLDYSI